MVRRLFAIFAGALVFAQLAAHTHADEKAPPKNRPALTPEEADADFPLQGEYSGEFETDEGNRMKVGVQVIALGEGKFRAVAYPGGLPGDGWDRERKYEVEAERQGDTVKFVGERATGILTEGVLTIVSAEGREIVKLKKIVRKSPTLGKKAPKGAVVLFPMKADLSGVTVGQGEYPVPAGFQYGRISPEGLLMQGALSKPKFQDFTLHLEFKLSYMPNARGQARSNSGIYMQGRYEVQVLDSFGLEGRDNECGGIYGVKAPDVNMCFPPLSWQTYDVEFTAPRFDDEGKKTANARITVRHNGVLIHDDVEIPGPTRGAPVKEGPDPGPLYIQDHGNPLRFRNIWVVEK